MNLLHRLVTAEPLLALFITIALGYLVGKIKISSFVLGGIAARQILDECHQDFKKSIVLQ